MPVAQGEPIRENKVIIGKRGGYLAAVLPAGIRAVSVDVSPDTAAGGFILPNDHVDVLLTHRDKGGKAGRRRQIRHRHHFAQRAGARDRSDRRREGRREGRHRQDRDIALTPEQAERLALAHQLGSISLALRSVVDSQSLVPQDGVAKKEDDNQAVNTVRFGIGAQTATSR